MKKGGLKTAGLIYSVKNKITGKFYIGATTNTIQQRKLDHTERANRGETGKFHEAISTYGPEAFKWEQIDNSTSINELAKKEKDYVLEYNSKNEGYNSDSGGGFKKTVYQYDLEDGSLIKRYDCLEKAAKVVDAIKQQISRACLSVNKTYGGYFWSYEYKEPFSPDIDKRHKKVNQFDLNGTYIYEFKSVSEASILTGCNKSSIAKVCRGKRNHAGGFIWKYK